MLERYCVYGRLLTASTIAANGNSNRCRHYCCMWRCSRRGGDEEVGVRICESVEVYVGGGTIFKAVGNAERKGGATMN